MRYQIIRQSPPQSPPVATVLGQTAALLGPNQCMVVPVSIPDAVIRIDGAPIIKWATSAPYNPVRRSIYYTGKAQSVIPYRSIEYFLDSNTVTNPAIWDSTPVSGHGYCHNTAHDTDGRHWARPYNDQTCWERSAVGVWTALPNSGVMEITSSLKWHPTLQRLLNIDGDRIRAYDPGVGAPGTGTWTLVQNFGDHLNAYYYTAAYNPNGDRMIFGAGNFDDTMRKIDTLTTSSAIATPPFNLGAGAFDGCTTADPNSPNFVACHRSTNVWTKFDPTAGALGTWSSVTQSSGSGATPQTGAPNVATGAGDVGASRILTTVPAAALGLAWGVVTTMEYVGGGGLLWAWRP